MEHLGDLIIASSAATLISHPFDVMVTKIGSQRYIKYENVVNAVQTIVKEEGLSKLLGSGIQFRLVSCLLSMYITAGMYPSLIKMVAEAY